MISRPAPPAGCSTLNGEKNSVEPVCNARPCIHAPDFCHVDVKKNPTNTTRWPRNSPARLAQLARLHTSQQRSWDFIDIHVARIQVCMHEDTGAYRLHLFFFPGQWQDAGRTCRWEQRRPFPPLASWPPGSPSFFMVFL